MNASSHHRIFHNRYTIHFRLAAPSINKSNIPSIETINPKKNLHNIGSKVDPRDIETRWMIAITTTAMMGRQATISSAALHPLMFLRHFRTTAMMQAVAALALWKDWKISKGIRMAMN
jgi:hypothetical protein